MNYPGTCSRRDRGPPQGNDGLQPGPSHRRRGQPCPGRLASSSAYAAVSRDQAGERFSDHFQHLASLRSFQTR